MQRLVLSASVLALLSGIALAAPAQAGSYNRHGNVTYSERAAIARSAAHLNAVKRHARADGNVSAVGGCEDPHGPGTAQRPGLAPAPQLTGRHHGERGGASGRPRCRAVPGALHRWLRCSAARSSTWQKRAPISQMVTLSH